MINLRILSVFLFLFVIVSCDSNRIVDQNISVNDEKWSKEEIQEFAFEITDTTQLYSVFINVRNTNRYKYSNLYLFVEMISPSEKFFMETREFILADNTGKWTGKGIGNVWQNQLSLLENVKLLEQGEYRIKLKQGMRDDTLEAISDVGIRVEIAR